MSDFPFPTVVYPKELYAAHLRIRSDRIDAYGKLRDAERIRGSMTRFLKRCVRDDPSIVVGTVTQISTHEDFLTRQWLLRAAAPAFQSVAPEDRACLEYWVDVPGAQAIQIPRLPSPPIPSEGASPRY